MVWEVVAAEAVKGAFAPNAGGVSVPDYVQTGAQSIQGPRVAVPEVPTPPWAAGALGSASMRLDTGSLALWGAGALLAFVAFKKMGGR